MDTKNLFPQLIEVNLQFVKDTIVPQIQPDFAKQLVSAILDRLVLTAEVMYDDNPDNQAQLLELWSQFTTDPKVYASFQEAFTLAANKVDDPNIKQGLLLLVPAITDTLVAVTDTQKPDGKQIESIWKSFIKSDNFINFALANLAVLIDKLKLPTWLKNIVNKFLP